MIKLLFSVVFLLSSAFSKDVPDISVSVDRFAFVFAMSCFENSQNNELGRLISEALSEKSDDYQNDCEQFVICFINDRPNDRRMTSTLIAAKKEALLASEKMFDSSRGVLEQRKEELSIYWNKFFKKDKIGFSKVYKFYGISPQLFKVFLYLSGIQGTFAKGFGTNIFLRFSYGKRTTDTCAVFKEICNCLYQRMPKARAAQVEHYFVFHKSPHAMAAYLILGETLAHAIGVRWIYQVLSSDSDSSPDPYSDPNIEKVSSEIFQTVNEYLGNKGELDDNFCESFIRIVAEQFPKAKDLFDIMLSKISLITENGIDITVCSSAILSSFNVRDITNKQSNYTTVFIGRNLGDQALKTISTKLPKKDNNFLFITKNNTNKLFIVICTNDETKIQTAVRRVKRLKEFTEDYVVDL
ncbi:MAG: hypothetical protein LBT03_03785 [Holosporales bacterium]|jgi:hypothetical protein|nr:hypothetical protein [Holosporales bacterium]